MAACIQAGSPVVKPPPSYPPVASFIPGDITINNFTNLGFEDTSENTPTSWQWSIDGSPFAITPNANYFFSYSGDFVIRLTVTNSYGTDYVEHTVSVAGGGVIP